MNKTTAKALEKSIKHWERMRDGKRRKTKCTEQPMDGKEWPSVDDCALCGLFFKKYEYCDGCPIMARTGRTHCNDSPYNNAMEMFDDYGADSDEFKAAAQAMIDFLISLRDQP